MPVVAPGVWAGVNDAFLIARQKEQEQQRLAESRQRMQRDQFDMQTARDAQMRDQRARQGFGQGLYGVYGAQPSPQPPAPGQSSAPPGPPQGQPPGPPTGGPPPGPPQPQAMGGPPAAPGMEDPALARAKGDVAALTRELSRPGLNAEQKRIMTSELSTAQARLAQLTTGQQPYRTMPTPGAAPAGGSPPAPGMQPPPPVSSTPQQPSLLKRFIMAAQRNNVPPEDLADQIKLLNPIMQEEMKQELATLRGTQAEQNIYIRQLLAENAIGREQRLTRQGDRRQDEKERHDDVMERQGAARLELAHQKAQQGIAPTASELDDPKVADYWYEQYKRGGDKPPFAWGKAGENDRRAWMRILAEKGGAGDVVASRAEAKATGSALTANTKRNAGLDVGARETLADINTLNGVIDKVATKGGAKILNRPINKVRELGSDPEYGQLELVTKQVATKYERMLAGGILSVAQLHEGAREDAKKMLSGDMTIQEIRAKLPLMKREMDNAIKAGKDTNKSLRDDLSGKPDGGVEGDEDAQARAWAKANPKDPRAKKILEHLGQ